MIHNIIFLIAVVILFFNSVLLTKWMARQEKKIDGIKAYTDAMIYLLRNAKFHDTSVVANDGISAQEIRDNINKILDDEQESEKRS